MPFNPFESVRISGTWEDHAGYSAGGTDLPLAYRTPIYAPARGHLYTSGRPPGVNASNEWACGWVGTAGRRSILMLESPIPRPVGGSRRLNPIEGEGPMVAIVFQHQSEMSVNSGPNTLYLENGGPIGFSGASASGQDYGGDVHLHWHGLNAAGQRLRVEAFLNRASNTAGDGGTPLPPVPLRLDPDMNDFLCVATSNSGMIGSGQRFVQGADGVLRVLSDGEWSVREHCYPDVNPAQWSGDQLETLIARVGLREYLSGPQYAGGVGPLTGKIIFTPTGARQYPLTHNA